MSMMNGWTDGWMDGWTDPTPPHTNLRAVEACYDAYIKFKKKNAIQSGQTDGRADESTDEQTGGRMGRRTDRQMGGRTDQNPHPHFGLLKLVMMHT